MITTSDPAGFSRRWMQPFFPSYVAIETALAKRGRAYSTFALMSAEEYEAGVAAAEASLPENIEYELLLLHVVATRP